MSQNHYSDGEKCLMVNKTHAWTPGGKLAKERTESHSRSLTWDHLSLALDFIFQLP